MKLLPNQLIHLPNTKPQIALRLWRIAVLRKQRTFRFQIDAKRLFAKERGITLQPHTRNECGSRNNHRSARRTAGNQHTGGIGMVESAGHERNTGAIEKTVKPDRNGRQRTAHRGRFRASLRRVHQESRHRRPGRPARLL